MATSNRVSLLASARSIKGGLLEDSGTSQRSQGFHESDYHTPTSRKKAILERNSTACLCLLVTIVVLTVALLFLVVGLRLTRAHNKEMYKITRGDTQLIKVNSHFCQAIDLIVLTQNVPLKMTLLNKEPQLLGSNNFTLNADFPITDFIDYRYEFGWYDYVEQTETIVNYVTLSYQLYTGSDIQLSACISSDEGEAELHFIEGKSNYQKWTNSFEGRYSNVLPIPSCDSSNLNFAHTIDRSERYYLVFKSITEEPFINITLMLIRTEYTVNINDQVSSCINNNSDCSLPLSLSVKPYYALIETIATETSNYGKAVDFTWRCQSRDWMYVIIFFIPLIFGFILFTSMYCIFVYFNKRKLKSYSSLNGGTVNYDSGRKVNLVYNDPLPSAI